PAAEGTLFPPDLLGTEAATVGDSQSGFELPQPWAKATNGSGHWDPAAGTVTSTSSGSPSHDATCPDHFTRSTPSAVCVGWAVRPRATRAGPAAVQSVAALVGGAAASPPVTATAATV